MDRHRPTRVEEQILSTVGEFEDGLAVIRDTRRKAMAGFGNALKGAAEFARDMEAGQGALQDGAEAEPGLLAAALALPVVSDGIFFAANEIEPGRLVDPFPEQADCAPACGTDSDPCREQEPVSKSVCPPEGGEKRASKVSDNRLLTPHVHALGREWGVNGRQAQKPPSGDWRTWLIMGGRGSGKTRAGAEWVHALASAAPRSDLRIALVAETLGDAREVMVDGASGICRIARTKIPDFEVSRRRLIWPNGAVAQIFSSEDPESLRGPQFHFAWCDELAKWKHAQETFDMLQFGLRLGTDPRQLVTTTPRPVPMLKALIADPTTHLVRMSTAANAKNLAPGFMAVLENRYGGTRLGRQEIAGELIEDRADALWKRADLEACVTRAFGAPRRIVVAVDPPSGSGEGSCCGIVVAGIEEKDVSVGALGRAVILADCSVEGLSPAGWAQAVTTAYRRFGADRVVAEVNQGGEMVTAMLKSIDAGLPVTMVRARRGKFLRAEPVAALYEQGRVLHAGRFVALEDQMCDFGPDGLSSGRSPDRLDALVWALTALVLDGQGVPRIRGL